MRQLSHIVWSEGMHLAQHHFQAQSRFFEDRVQFALQSLFFRPYGLVACELDAEAVRNDIVSLVQARGMMPDGLPFDIPGSEPVPPPLPIRDRFSPTSDSHLVLLGIPAYRADQPNVLSNGGTALPDVTVRYTAHTMLVRDDMTGRDERALAIGRKNLCLLLDTESARADATSMITLPIARVRRDGTGHFVYDPDYIPPSLHIGASQRLMTLLQRLVEILEARADSFARGRRGSTDEFAQREVAGFWLLHTIHASLPTLRHYVQARRIHPERAYVELARLAGALCTFSLDAQLRTLPPYDHSQPEACFDALDRHIRAHLDVVTPSGLAAIRLVPSGPSVYSAEVRDPRSFSAARWILGVRSSLTADELRVRVPTLGKVCSNKFVLELVKRGVPGLTIDYLPYPPAAIAPRPGTQYFLIERAGPCWETIVATQQVGVYIPDEIPNAELDLSIVPESSGENGV
jgi:type VI secretion system protein ImpJ